MKNNLITIALIFLLINSSFSQIPTYFDLRDVNGNNYVTSVKSQQGGTCWTHGVMAAIEGNLMISGIWNQNGETGEPNLAEYHLDWWNGFNLHYNQDIYPVSAGLVVHYGGDYRVASAYLSRGEGAVRDVDGQEFNNAPDRFNPSYHYYYPENIEWLVSNTATEQILLMKKKIMQNGVLGTCMCYSPSFMTNDYIHYQPNSDSTEPNHAIAIVGWDDNKTTQYNQPGAWICKNSWDTTFGYDGYFWISYYDRHCGHHPEMGAISFSNVVNSNFKKVYYHDYHGWRDTKLGITNAMNAFKASENGTISLVGFYTAADSVNYKIKIWSDFFNNNLSQLLEVDSGNISHQGWHTIHLDNPVNILANDSFFIELDLSHGGHPIDCTSDVPVLLGSSQRATVSSTANIGESFYLDGTTWTDLNYENETANFCIKAITTYTSDIVEFSSYPEKVCFGTDTSNIEVFNGQGGILEFDIKPNTAGTIESGELNLYIDWNENYFGEVIIKVKVHPGDDIWLDSILINVVLAEEINLGNDTSICAHEGITLNPESGLSWNWNIDGTNNSINQSIFIDTSIVGFGNHLVILEMNDNSNCYTTDTIWIYLDNCLGQENLEISEQIEIEYLQNNISISGLENSNAELEIFNISGELLLRKSFLVFNNESDIKINQAFSGILIIKISQNSKSFGKVFFK